MEENNSQKRKFLGIWFDCCNTYGRIYKTPDGNFYRGRCPKCLRSVSVRVSDNGEGTDRRFFRGS